MYFEVITDIVPILNLLVGAEPGPHLPSRHNCSHTSDIVHTAAWRSIILSFLAI